MQIRRGLFCDDMCMLLQPNQFGEGGSGRPARNQYGELLDAGVLAGPDDQQSEYVNQLAPSRGLDGRVQTGAPARPFRESQLGRQAQAPARPVRPATRYDSGEAAPTAALGQGVEAMVAALHGGAQGSGYLDEENSAVGDDEDGSEAEAADQLGELGASGEKPTSPLPISLPADSTLKPPSVGKTSIDGDDRAGKAGEIKHVYFEVKHIDEALLNRYFYLRKCDSVPIRSALASGTTYSCRQSGKRFKPN